MRMRKFAPVCMAMVMAIGASWVSAQVPRMDRCAVCSGRFGLTVYLVEDGIEGGKKRLCYACSILDMCYYCGVPAGEGRVEIGDGRVVCRRDAKDLILTEEAGKEAAREAIEELNRFLSNFMTFPTTNVTFSLVDRIDLDALFGSAGRDRTCPNLWGFMSTNGEMLGDIRGGGECEHCG